jgi:SpoIVB peptidase S55
MRYAGILLLLCLSVAPCLAATPDGIMPLSEVKEGMIGVGRTVLKGNQQEEFQVEILGVLRNYLPQQNLILAQCKGANLEDTGIIAGMSGSPVYVDGKMIGAVAYSWPFAKTPIAGITPIESMLETELMPQQIPPAVPPVEVANYYDFENLLANHLASPAPVAAAVSQIGKVELQPIAAPLSVSGFDQRVIDRFAPLFSSFGLQAVQSGAAGTSDSPSNSDLRPGDAISVQLITGDFDMGAIGTVTYRDKDRLLAFGHPFFNLGPINLPMATAKIYGVVPSLYSSFKIGASQQVVGTIKQDLHSAVFGLMGNQTAMIPVTVNMKNDDNSHRTFNFQVANHNLLSPVLVDFAFQNSMLVTQPGYAESTVRVSGKINLKDRNPVTVNNIFSGAGSFSNASQYVATILYALMGNEFKSVQIQDVVIDVDASLKRKEAELVEVWIDKAEVRPGDEVRIKAVYRPYLGEKQVQEFKATIPTDYKSTQIQFVVGGGQEISRLEYMQYGKAYQPDSIDQMVALLSNLRSNDRIYVKAFGNDQSLLMKGQFLTSLPASAYSMLSSSQTIGSSQKVARLALWEASKPIDYYLTGTRSFSLKVLPRQN